MTTSYSREELATLVRVMAERAPALPNAGDLDKAFKISAITMAGSDTGMLINFGIVHEEKPIFFFLNCVVARELYSAIETAEAKVWTGEIVTTSHDDEMVTPTLQDMASAADVLSLTTAADPQGILVNLRGAGEALMIYVARYVALRVAEGISVTAEAADWWDENLKLFPVDTPPRRVGELDVWRAANQIIQSYRDNAQFEAKHRADMALTSGDIFNFLLWERVVAAIHDLQRKKSDDERL